MRAPGRRNGSRNRMVTELSRKDPPPAPLRSAVVDRLEQYRILPPNHDRLPTNALDQIEQLFVTWYELGDDASRRAALSYVFASENEIRAALLAIVPLYYDTMFFDERTPTRDLVEIALVAHAKWRRWLSASAAAS